MSIGRPPVPVPRKTMRADPARRPWTTLVTVAWLHDAIEARAPGALVVLDVRHDLKDPDKGPRVWAEGHVEGAQHAHVDRDLSAPPGPGTGRHPLPDPDAFRETCSRWGIDDSAQVVCYDDFGGAWASRGWWLLRYYGHRAVAVLDGGLPAWTAAGHRLSRAAAPAQPRAFTGTPGAMPTVTTWDLVTRAPRCLMDARGPARFRGDDEPVDPVAGHIPHAVNVPFAGNTDERGRFLAPALLRARYEAALGGRRPEEAAFYCGSGVTAPHDILAMEVAGLPGASLYPGSWSEWIRYPLRPVARGPY